MDIPCITEEGTGMVVKLYSYVATAIDYSISKFHCLQYDHEISNYTLNMFKQIASVNNYCDQVCKNSFYLHIHCYTLRINILAFM